MNHDDDLENIPAAVAVGLFGAAVLLVALCVVASIFLPLVLP
ncbi:MAG: hypothetical protein ACK5A0_11035 [Polaromonas sp.]